MEQLTIINWNIGGAKLLKLKGDERDAFSAQASEEIARLCRTYEPDIVVLQEATRSRRNGEPTRELIDPPPVDEDGWVTGMEGNPTGIDAELLVFSLDGVEGRGSRPFVASADAAGTEFPFAIAWVGTPDVAGGVIARAQGLYADLLRSRYSAGFDNADAYRLVYLALFGKQLPPAAGGSCLPNRAR